MKFSFVTYIKRIKVVKNFDGSSLSMYDKSNKDVCFINFLSIFVGSLSIFLLLKCISAEVHLYGQYHFLSIRHFERHNRNSNNYMILVFAQFIHAN